MSGGNGGTTVQEIPDVSALSDEQLEDLFFAAQREREVRRVEKSVHGEPVVVQLEIDPGNTRAGAKRYVKQVRSIDPSQGSGYGIEGDFIPAGEHRAFPEGTYLLAGGRGGSWKNSTASAVLLRVKRGESFSHHAGYQEFRGEGLELVATSGDELDRQEVINSHPELAPALKSHLFPIFLALRQLGF